MTYETTDLNTAVVLFELGNNFIEVNKTDPKRVKFCFQDSDMLQNQIKKFYNKELLLEPSSLFSAQKVLKTRIYSV